jgi:hypothetical protein
MIREVRPHDAAAWGSLRTALWPYEAASELQREARAFVDGAGDFLDLVLLAESDDTEPELVGFLELSVRAGEASAGR